MATTRFKFARRRVTELRRFMLPGRFDPTGLYPDRIHQRTAAFRLLVHAEFESYLEERVTGHVTERVQRWRTDGKPSITLAALCAYDDHKSGAPTSILKPPQKPAPSFEERLDGAAKRFNTFARAYNHGVREANVLALVLPIGIDGNQLDAAWLGDLDGWASERGDLAHQSSGKVKIKLDPAKELSKARALLDGFAMLDTLISRLP